jgi:hypothetical protein
MKLERNASEGLQMKAREGRFKGTLARKRTVYMQSKEIVHRKEVIAGCSSYACLYSAHL